MSATDDEPLFATSAFVEALAETEGRERVVDLWAVVLDQGDGERIGAFEMGNPDGGRIPLLLISPEREQLARFDLDHMARLEGATVRLRHFRACHDQTECRP
jgi:hypothetical protein